MRVRIFNIHPDTRQVCTIRSTYVLPSPRGEFQRFHVHYMAIFIIYVNHVDV